MIQIYLGIRLYQKFHECHTLVQVLSCLVNLYNMLRAKLLSISFSVIDVICRGFCYQGNKIELVAAKTTVCSQTRCRKDGNLRKNLFLVLKTNRI